MWQSIKNFYHLAMAVLANVFYGFPSKKLTVIGVTGTDGKTTTVNLIYHILKTAGKQVSMISSVGAVINGKNYDTGFHVTTPSSWQLQSFLKKAEGYLVLEVTSHALDQYRVWGINFAVGVLTNVTNEHLDYHKTYENYAATKAKLLKIAKVAVVNKDDEAYGIIAESEWITYGLSNNSDVNPENFPFKTKLVGEFNKYNILAGAAAGRALGIDNPAIRKAISSFKLPIGRMEVVHPSTSSGQVDFTVMIDFAHTPNALEQVLSTVKKNTKGRLIHVFGSAGERDFQKRPEMGRVSGKYADVIILTAEDPRSESVEKITDRIEEGIRKLEVRSQPPEASLAKGGKLEVRKIADRQEAITTAVKMVKKGDVVIITGKGHEQSMNYGKGEVAWSEHEAVKQALKKR